MKIQLVAIGSKMPAWVNQGFSEYAGRLPRHCQLELLELPAVKRGKNADIARVLEQEASLMAARIPPKNIVVALDRRGKHIDTQFLAGQLERWIDDAQDVSLVIGGPEGLDSSFLDSVPTCWSLSKLTFAHPMVRIIIAEQVYRAWSVIAGLPYHRGD